jgi:two-component system OmpR family response regulator
MQARTILVVEDEAAIASAVAARLRSEGFRVEVAASGPAGVELARTLAPDLVLLDWMLPGFDGIEACRRIQADRPVPVVFLTARDAEADVLVGLGMGADDYVTKPFSPRELLARIRAVLRRRQEPRNAEEGIGAGCEFSGWRLDLVRRELRTPDGVVVNLSSGEFSLLRAFVERPQRVLTRDQLLDFARGPDTEAYDRAIDVQISRLRKKLEDGAGGQELIRTIRNEGYMFTAKVTRT